MPGASITYAPSCNVDAVDVGDRREARAHVVRRRVDAEDHALARPEPSRELGRRALADERARAITITRSQSASTSERMWVESSTVRVPAQAADELADLDDLPRVEADRRLVEDRIGGSPRSACASPTRWR